MTKVCIVFCLALGLLKCGSSGDSPGGKPGFVGHECTAESINLEICLGEIRQKCELRVDDSVYDWVDVSDCADKDLVCYPLGGITACG